MTIIDYIILVLSNISNAPSEVIYFSTNHKYIYILKYIAAFLISSFIFYYFLYGYFNLERKISSYMSIVSFNVMFLLYIRGIYHISNFDIQPIYIDTLSLFANYRYLFLSFIAIFMFCLWYLSLYFSSLKFFLEIFSYPYIKEEIRRLLYVWNNAIMGPFCNYIYEKILNSYFFCKIFFILHFFLFYVIRFIIGCLLINFVFFQGNLVWLFYMLPFSFFIWFLGFIDYYFKIFREGTTNYLKEILLVTYKKNLTLDDVKRGYVFTDLDAFEFTLLPLAKKEGFHAENLNYLINKWYESAKIDLKFQEYYESLKLFNVFLICIFCSCWFLISYKFLMSSLLNESFLYFFYMFRRFPLKVVSNDFGRMPPPPREAYRVCEGASMNHVKTATGGAVSPGHPVIGEVEGSDLRVDAALTHGVGKPPNLSEPLSTQGIPPDAKPVNAIPIPGGPKKIPLHHFEPKPIPNSQAFCESANVKACLDNISTPKNDGTNT